MWILCHAYAIINMRIIHPPTGQHLCAPAPGEPHVNSICKAAQCPVSKDNLNDVGELVGLVSCSDATDGSTINTNPSFDSNPVYQKLHDSFSVHFFLSDGIIRREYALFRISVASVVPDEHVALSSEEEVKPIGVGGSYHPLVDHGVRIGNYDRGLVNVLLLLG